MQEWVDYWRAPDRPLEAMHAHLRRRSYGLHSHDTYSFGVTETGAQAFRCRGAARISAAGMVMAFNPDEPHDGRSAVEQGFTYRMVHIGPELMADVLGDSVGRPAGLPLFVEPVLGDTVLAGALRCLHDALREGSTLGRDDALSRTVRALVRRGATRPPAGSVRRVGVAGLDRAVELLRSDCARDVTAAELAGVAGCSRYALHRAFVSRYGLAPGDYQRQLRLRLARGLLAAGRSPAEAAGAAGFADQSHLTRWFRSCYGVTPGVYRQAVSGTNTAGAGWRR